MTTSRNIAVETLVWNGVGYGKSAFLELELGTPAIDLMRAVKRAFDPDELFNPGKILPE